MRASTALALAAASSATALAQTAAEQYPYGYWDVTLTSNYTGNHDGVRRNITLVFTDDNRIVSDEAKEYHCWSDFGSSTLTEQKHCDNQYLDFIIVDKCNERASASKDPNTKEGENLSRGFSLSRYKKRVRAS
ncbi:hypothetical protein MPH_06960 [Macrophomina phaseolina MS6]|uniref:AA1-like domain-containing protein n=1 Tax=Macrophomina phaseolina (strain MS6) TaxID=1126212 RepID=K2R0S2_MACPH|nr:hypothetical protein MPH_06960 [Macrophomina phaseolina MS6]